MEKQEIRRNDLIKVDENIYEIPRSFRADMRVPARIFMHEDMIEDVMGDRSLEQIVNVATLPGIKQYALAMPDIHQGYGFPIGGVAATVVHEGGVISPGGIGYDINCGVRLLASNLSVQESFTQQEILATELYNAVPSGVGRGGTIKLSGGPLDDILRHGAAHAVTMGYGTPADLAFCEEHGCMANADHELISKKAKDRASDQLGTLGSGNHFLEVQFIEEIYDQAAAQAFGLHPGCITVMIHCGSRGLGHQTCTDYVRQMAAKLVSWNFTLPDRELACAPLSSDIGKEYISAMAAAANFGWANRQVIAHQVRQAFSKVLGSAVSLHTVYDVAHNIGKFERHTINGTPLDLMVHRKGATRAFGPGNPAIPAVYQPVGQPVIIPGTMGTASYVLAGNTKSMELSFGSSCHGAGRRMSRTKARGMVRGTTLREQLHSAGIIIRCDSNAGLAEEAPIAYKDVDKVVKIVHDVGLARIVARLKPIIVVKGG